MLYPDQPTPPFNSPYQHHASRTGPLLESPYPSPGQQDPRSKYPQGLGLYEGHHTYGNGLPPSPQPSEDWCNRFHHSATQEVIADPYASGAFEHPVSRSPLPWNSSQTPPRSSLSYTREMSAFSHDGSEHTYPRIKTESSAWNPDACYGTDVPVEMTGIASSGQSPLTVNPDRLSTHMYPYENVYTPFAMSRYEQQPVFDYPSRPYERQPSEESIGSQHSRRTRSIYSAGRGRSRNRRYTDPANAPFHCEVCPNKGFARRYNFNQHMLTHDQDRKKDNFCAHAGCDKRFVRKTDLVRHDISVHQKVKPYRCTRCSSAFPRKDTLRRHEEDGCPRRNQVMTGDPIMSHDSFSNTISRI
ncbi:epithelial zinc-finger ezf [Pyrenophora seminiperda CCB06]|uniref:Epithelial zinc-finger ezf n=1 Tax=Pyrenophora seminiperda CCB06 TaxID=1302712 RepID=A0A3M7MDU4_9PLEO|nr:epithelial zinc-finger ezf [Pyrenophora seminiperda CCB06]